MMLSSAEATKTDSKPLDFDALVSESLNEMKDFQKICQGLDSLNFENLDQILKKRLSKLIHLLVTTAEMPLLEAQEETLEKAVNELGSMGQYFNEVYNRKLAEKYKEIIEDFLNVRRKIYNACNPKFHAKRIKNFKELEKILVALNDPNNLYALELHAALPNESIELVKIIFERSKKSPVETQYDEINRKFPGWNTQSLFKILKALDIKNSFVKQSSEEPKVPFKEASDLFKKLECLRDIGADKWAYNRDVNDRAYGLIVCDLAWELLFKAHEFFDDKNKVANADERKKFDKEFNLLLHSQDDTVKIHVSKFRKIISEISQLVLLALTVVGLPIYVAVKKKNPFVMFTDFRTDREIVLAEADSVYKAIMPKA